jgi:hypothetical protein
VILRAVFVSMIVLIGMSIVIRMIASTGKVRNSTLLNLFERVGQFGSIVSGLLFVGGFLFLLVGVILLLANSSNARVQSLHRSTGKVHRFLDHVSSSRTRPAFNQPAIVGVEGGT